MWFSWDFSASVSFSSLLAAEATSPLVYFLKCLSVSLSVLKTFLALAGSCGHHAINCQLLESLSLGSVCLCLPSIRSVAGKKAKGKQTGRALSRATLGWSCAAVQ